MVSRKEWVLLDVTAEYGGIHIFRVPPSFPTDIYVAEVSSTHNVCAKDVYVAMVSTIVETGNPEAELDAGLKLLGPIHEK